MSDTVTIRQATAGDIDRIVAIENRSFGSDRFSRRQFSHLIRRARGVFYVAIYEDDIAGYISLLEHKKHTTLRIYAIAVHPDFRGKQVAQALMDEAVRYAQRQGLAALSLEVQTDNTVALNLYTKNGFSVTSLKKSYYSDGSDAYRMKKQLRPPLTFF